MTAQIPGLGEVIIGETKIRHRPTGAVGVARSIDITTGIEPSSVLVLASPQFGEEYGPNAEEVTHNVAIEDCEIA
jgi:hypothetical protein